MPCGRFPAFARLTHLTRHRIALGALVFVLGLGLQSGTIAAVDPLPVMAAVETAAVPNDGDAADDPAIWVHPTNPALSLIIGTDKKGGLAVYDLTGRELQYLPDGDMNNVDLRPGFPLGGQRVALVTASNRTDDSMAVYLVNPVTRRLEQVAARTIAIGASYGACMYRSPVSGKFYYFGNSERGLVEQWELFDNGTGKVDAVKVREFDVGSQTEGCVADDELGNLYIGEEAVGIWKYGAEPGAGTTRTKVDSTGSAGYLTKDVEGLTIFYGSTGSGYLIASSQGSDSFVVYRREGTNPYVATFQIVAGNGIDAVTQTDGIDVSSASLGPVFPQGIFVAQDGRNDGCNQNFKLVSWQAIAAVLGQGQPGRATARRSPEHMPGADLAADALPERVYFPLIRGAGC